MTRAEFMEKLKNLLLDIPEGERDEALNYYEDYFDDAGAEKEADVINSLGSPEKVAKTIRDGLNDSEGVGGEYSETGYYGYGEMEKEEVVQYGAVENKKFSDRFKGNGGLILLLILAIFALPILGPVIIGIGSALLGVLLAAAAVLFALVIVGIILLVSGAVVFAGAFGCLFVTPATAAMMFGLSFLLIGIGILLTISGIWVLTKLIPQMFRGIVTGIRKIFVKKEE